MAPTIFISGHEFKNYLNAFLYEILRIMEILLTFLTVSSLFIGVVGFFVAYIVYAMLQLEPDLYICTCIFLMVFSTYSLDKLTDSKEDNVNLPERANFVHGRKKLVLFYSLAAYMLSALMIFLRIPRGLIIVALPIAISAAYGRHLIPGVPRLKDIPVMKNFIVALTWASIAVLLPGMQGGSERTIALVFYFVFVKCFINTVLFDIRDVSGDRKNGVMTIPVLFGSSKTIIFLLAINSTLLFWIILAQSTIRPLAMVLILYGYAYIFYFKEHRSASKLDLLVDGEWIIISAALLIWQFFCANPYMVKSLFIYIY